jgi:hypothetical protein
VSGYLEKLRKQWRQELTTPAGEQVSGHVTVILDALRYRAAEKALEKLEEGKTTQEIVPYLRGYVRAVRNRYAGRPILEAFVNVANSYGLFFPKHPLKAFFVVKYNDKTVAKQVLEDDARPRYESWMVYTRDGHKMPRHRMTFWLFQGRMRVRMVVGSPWKNERLSLELAGMWGQGKVTSGFGGWNQQRRTLQFEKRSPLDFRSGAVSFYAADREGKRVAPPPALAAVFEGG